MTTQAWLLMDEAQWEAAVALDVPNSGIAFGGRIIDNPLANQLGEGTIVGNYVVGARLLNDPDYTGYYELCSSYPIRTMDSEVLFLPPPPL